jgi:hypothetical protein
VVAHDVAEALGEASVVTAEQAPIAPGAAFVAGGPGEPELVRVF